MEKLNQKKLGLATGLASVVIYFSCSFVMAVLGKESLVKISNLLFHGMDFSKIIRMNITTAETLLGAVVSFIFWGLTGYFIAVVYNKFN